MESKCTAATRGCEPYFARWSSQRGGPCRPCSCESREPACHKHRELCDVYPCHDDQGEINEEKLRSRQFSSSLVKAVQLYSRISSWPRRSRHSVFARTVVLRSIPDSCQSRSTRSALRTPKLSSAGRRTGSMHSGSAMEWREVENIRLSARKTAQSGGESSGTVKIWRWWCGIGAVFELQELGGPSSAIFADCHKRVLVALGRSRVILSYWYVMIKPKILQQQPCRRMRSRFLLSPDSPCSRVVGLGAGSRSGNICSGELRKSDAL